MIGGTIFFGEVGCRLLCDTRFKSFARPRPRSSSSALTVVVVAFGNFGNGLDRLRISNPSWDLLGEFGFKLQAAG